MVIINILRSRCNVHRDKHNARPTRDALALSNHSLDYNDRDTVERDFAESVASTAKIIL